jgi:hypothetical protein
MSEKSDKIQSRESPNFTISNEKVKDNKGGRDMEILRKQSKLMKEKLDKIIQQNNTKIVESEEQTQKITQREWGLPEKKIHDWDEYDHLETSSERIEEESEISVHTITKQPSKSNCQNYLPKEMTFKEKKSRNKDENKDNVEFFGNEKEHQRLLMKMLLYKKPVKRILKGKKSLSKNYSFEVQLTGDENDQFDYSYNDAFQVGKVEYLKSVDKVGVEQEKVLEEWNFEVFDLEDTINIIEEYNRHHNRKIFIPEEEGHQELNDSLKIEDDNGEVNFIVNNVSSSSSLLTEEILHQGYLYKFSSQNSKVSMKWWVLNTNFLILTNTEIGNSAQMGIRLSAIKRICPSVATHNGKTIYKFELVTEDTHLSCNSDRGTYTNYLNMKFDQLVDTQKPYSRKDSHEGQGQGHQNMTSRLDEVDKKIDEMFACVDDEPYAEQQEKYKSQPVHEVQRLEEDKMNNDKEIHETEEQFIKHSASFPYLQDLKEIKPEKQFSEIIPDLKSWILGTEVYSEFESWMAILKSNIQE